MVLVHPKQPLELRELLVPRPAPTQVLLRVHACGVCRTDLHIADGELERPKLPLVLGHQIVGRVVQCGSEVQGLPAGTRVGVPWLGYTDGCCSYCLEGRENLCRSARFTGYDLDGGYAEYAVADARFCFALGERGDDVRAAPLLCAGLIGYRALRLCAGAQRIGLYGFGAAAHIAVQVLRHQGREALAFTRPGDVPAQELALRLGASWAGPSDALPPEPLDAAILFAPVGALVPTALAAVAPGGRVVCAGIHMSDIPSFPYRLLWEERSVCSVANLTRQDGEEFLRVWPEAGIETEVTVFELERANEALAALREGRVTGSIVLTLPAP
jgi:propanol-preferring alcohol dehydrogenase